MWPRHAAALALVGWYLMVPPLLPRLSEGEPYLGFLPLAPLSQWTIVDFDSARGCIDAHARLLRDRVMKNVNDEIRIEQAYSARCIATDDPRLKEK
jgi:hypothetical protein